MSAVRLCSHCFVRLITNPDHPFGWCPKCRREVRSPNQARKQVKRVAPGAAVPPGGGRPVRPPHLPPVAPPAVHAPVAEPARTVETASSPTSCPPPCPLVCTCPKHETHPRRRKLGGVAVLAIIVAASLLLLGGLGLAYHLSEPSAKADDSAEQAPNPEPTQPQAPRRTAAESHVPPPLSAEVLREKELRAIFQSEAVPAATVLEDARRIDELVLARLKDKGITPAAPCSDGVFVRRVYLDVIGRIPTAEEAKEFLDDTKANRRQVLIDQLLGHRDYADYWTMRWCDLLRVKSEFPINLWPNAVQAYHRWIRTAMRENMPFDQFARTLLTSSGSNFRDPPVNFYRAVQGKDAKNISQAVALTFMGVRPETWTKEQWTGMSGCFSKIAYKATSEWKEEIVLFDPRKAPETTQAVMPDGVKITFQPDQDPREAFVGWLIRPENPWFTRNIANRAWSWLVGRGIVHEADDLRPSNPPSNPELLAHLEKVLVAARYDVKQLFRVILNSRTYQFSSLAASNHPEAPALFASYPIRRVDAEVLIDAICDITGTTEKYFSPIPEPFTYIPEGHRSVTLADASINSSFLEMFGRPPRDTGLESERNNTFSAAQRLHLLNSSHILRKIEQGPGLQSILSSGRPMKERAADLYLTILSRYPTDDELATLAEYSQSGTWGRRPGVDIAWALINSAEFLCRH